MKLFSQYFHYILFRDVSPQFSDALDDEYLAAMAEHAEKYALKTWPHFKFRQLIQEIIDGYESKSATSDESNV